MRAPQEVIVPDSESTIVATGVTVLTAGNGDSSHGTTAPAITDAPVFFGGAFHQSSQAA